MWFSGNDRKSSDHEEGSGMSSKVPPAVHKFLLGDQFNIKLSELGKLNRVASLALSSKEDGVVTKGFSLGIIPLSIILFLGYVAAEFVAYFVGLIPSDFYLALVGIDRSYFDRTMIKCVFLVLLSGWLLAFNNMTSELIRAKARLALTTYTQNIYIKKYTLSRVVLEKKIDNPDQRVTQDIDKLAQSFMTVVSNIIISPVLVVYYSVKTWKITEYVGPVACYVYFLIGVVVTMLLIPMVSSRVFRQERAEGNQHVLIRDKSEEISFYGGEQKVREEAQKSLKNLFRKQISVVYYGFPVSMAANFFSYMGSSLSYAIVAFPVFSGKYDDLSGAELASKISQSSFMAMYLIYTFTTIISVARDLADIVGYAARITSFWDELDILNSSIAPSWIHESVDETVQVVDISISTPSGVELVSNLSFSLKKGDHLIITGPNGYASIPSNDESPKVLFIPQKPYMVYGSLRDQIVYPYGQLVSNSNDDSQAKLVRVIKETGLSHLLKPEFHLGFINEEHMFLIEDFEGVINSGLEITHNSATWDSMLSPGEQQRLAIARILFWEPEFAFLDESTSSISSDAVASLYEKLLELNTTIISVSHNQNLIPYHKFQLELDSGISFKFHGV
ncbi:ATP-binding cassette sub-family D member 4 [Smittium mucronatum]|uniref:ATP-binding cassette sub-family D member 4 n=1 Tax=Smittium mucronatum TaxID=133383 RepID=A0A1R0GXM8_9FUNG|nr:ATP-binding cassette sub-family D member 4 [Smittium mucronatum]